MESAMSRSPDCIPEETLIELAEGTLPDERRTVVEAHLTGCVACYTALEWIKLHVLRKLDINGEPISDFLDKVELTDSHDVATRSLDGESYEAEGIAVLSHSNTSLGKQSEYQIVRVLGRGGYGIVLEANDTILQRRVAIKVLKRDLANRDTQSLRSLRD